MDDLNNVRVDLDSLQAPIDYASAGYRVYPYNEDNFQPVSLTSGDLMQAWIDMAYDGASFRVEVTLAPFPMNMPSREFFLKVI